MTGYISNIPDGGDNLSTSQGQMQTNFGVLQSLYSIDHTGWTNVAGNGTHKKVTFNDVAAPGVPVSPASVAYTKTVGTPSREELFFRNSFAETQVTSNGNDIWKGSAAAGGNGQVITALSGSEGDSGSVVFPNGMAMIWGSFNPNDETDITFPGTGAPGWPTNGFLNKAINLQLTLGQSGSTGTRTTFKTGSLTKTGFTFQGTVTSSAAECMYFAIGR